jgi:hypothetical protein
MRAFKQISVLITQVLLCTFCFSQREKIDSLLNVLSSLNDTARIDCLNELSNLYSEMENKDSAKYFADFAYARAKQLNYIPGIAVALSHKSGIARHFDDDFKGSEALGLEALSWFEKTSNKKGINELYIHLWDAHFSQSKFDEARYYGQKKYEWCKKLNDQPGTLHALLLISFTYYQQGDFENTFYYLQNANEIALQIGDETALMNNLFYFGALYRGIGDNATALTYYKRGFGKDNPELERQRINTNLDIWVKTEFAELLTLQHEYDSAWHYYSLFDTLHIHPKDLRVYHVSVGEYYFIRGEYDKALYSFLKSLPYHQQLNDNSQVIRTELDIAKTYLSLKNDSAALKYGREALDLALQTKARHLIRDAYEILSNAYDHLHQTDSAYGYYRKYITIKEGITNDQVKGKLAAYSYEQKISVLNKEKQLQTVKLQQQSTLKNILVAGVLILLVLGFIVLRNIILKRRNEKLKGEQIQNQLKQKASELEMQALRAQMNPHFIFNSLNSINMFILENNKLQASEYLSKFSKLIRLILQNSQEAFIPLERELESLQLYLELESLRFEQRFEYKINVAGNVDTAMLKVPPLIIQPYAENAIWHGLMHLPDRQAGKKEKGHLEIELYVKEGILFCRITDDGIGRKKANELKSKSASIHKSMGMRITADRIAMIQQQNKTSITITDLVLADGDPGGTEVLIKIPVSYD